MSRRLAGKSSVKDYGAWDAELYVGLTTLAFSSRGLLAARNILNRNVSSFLNRM